MNHQLPPHLAANRSNNQLVELHRNSILYLSLDFDVETPIKFTCDGCQYRNTCALAYDPYNTNGECLAFK